MDHSSIIYLMDPEGSFVKHFTYSTDAGSPRRRPCSEAISP